MIISLTSGLLQANCYLVYDEKSHKGVIVDPGGDTEALLQKIAEADLSIEAILNTHAHFDHIEGNAALEKLGAPLGLHPDDYNLLAIGGGSTWFGREMTPSPTPSIALTNNYTLKVGQLHIKVLHTPGHSPGSICLFIAEENALLTGDTLFAGSVGRTDLPGGDARALINSLKRLLTLPTKTLIYPGHGPSSSLAKERASNPLLKRINS